MADLQAFIGVTTIGVILLDQEVFAAAIQTGLYAGRDGQTGPPAKPSHCCVKNERLRSANT